VSDSRTQTNSNLFYTQTLLNTEQNEHLQLDIPARKAMLFAVCLCLKNTWNSWLNELGEFVHLELKSMSDLSGKNCHDIPECQRLLAIESDADSWLNYLLNVISSPEIAVQDLSPERPYPAQLRIDVKLVDDSRVLDHAKRLDHTIKEFKLYIHSVRSNQTEW
jgi:hypothetical protein